MSYQGQQKDKMIIKKISIRQKYLNKFEKKTNKKEKEKKEWLGQHPLDFFLIIFILFFFFLK